MLPAEYVPIYDETVTEVLLNSTDRTPYHGRGYCLMLSSARLLASLFTPPPAIIMLPPTKQYAGSPYTFNHDVPWFKFADGTLRNAGGLAQYWGMPGVPDPLAECLLDVATLVEGQ